MVHGAMEGSKASMLTAVITRMVTHVAMLIIVSHVAMVLPAMIMTIWPTCLVVEVSLLADVTCLTGAVLLVPGVVDGSIVCTKHLKFVCHTF
jgi:hypothetical protein